MQRFNNANEGRRVSRDRDKNRAASANAAFRCHAAQNSNSGPVAKQAVGMDSVLNVVINDIAIERVLIGLSGSTASYKAFRWYFNHLDSQNKMAIGFMVINPLDLEESNDNNIIDKSTKFKTTSLKSLSKELGMGVDHKKTALKTRLKGGKVFEEKLREKLNSVQNRRFIFVFEIMDDAAKALCDAVENFHCSFVVLGSSGRFPIVDDNRRTTRVVLDNAKSPVLVADRHSI